MIRNQPLFTGDTDEILRAIRHVRNRWRLRVALRGVAVLMAAVLGTLLLSSWGLEIYRFSPTAIVAFRVVTYLALIGFGWWLFVRPSFRRVDRSAGGPLSGGAPADLPGDRAQRGRGVAQGGPRGGRGPLARDGAAPGGIGGRQDPEHRHGPHGRAAAVARLVGAPGGGRRVRRPALRVRSELSPARRHGAADADEQRGGGQPVFDHGPAG